MNHKSTDKEVLEKVVQKLNEKGYSKKTISKISKEDLKPILREIYKEYHNLGGLEKSQKESWSKACAEIIDEFKDNNKEDTKTQQKDDNYKSVDKEDNKKDQSKREDYDDDLIQLEFPQVYSDKIHGSKIEKLSEQLERQRKEERQIKEDCEKNISEEIKRYKETLLEEKFNFWDFFIGESFSGICLVCSNFAFSNCFNLFLSCSFSFSVSTTLFIKIFAISLIPILGTCSSNKVSICF